MLTIGLAGGSGSGKGEVGAIFQKFGFKVIDTDKIYRKMTAPGGACLIPLAEEFGFGIILADGSLNRKALARIVFTGEGHTERKRRLEQITHRLILDETRKRIADYKSKGVCAGIIVDAPLLFESGFDKECDKIIGVVADKAKRIERIVQRDKITEQRAEERIAAQLSDEYVISRSDFVITNDGAKEELELQVTEIINKL